MTDSKRLLNNSIVKNKAAIARFFQVSPKTVTKWSQRDDWPWARSFRGPFELEAVVEWREKMQANSTRANHLPNTLDSSRPRPELDEITKVNIAYKREQTGRIRRENALFDRKYVDREAVVMEITREIQQVKSILLAEPRAAVEDLINEGLLVTGPSVQQRAIQLYSERIRAVCERLAEGFHQSTEYDAVH